MKTPMKNRENVRSVQISVSASPNEKELFQNEADKKGITLSNFMRLAAYNYSKRKMEWEF